MASCKLVFRDFCMFTSGISLVDATAHWASAVGVLFLWPIAISSLRARFALYIGKCACIKVFDVVFLQRE